MASGIEIAGLALAIFPVAISCLEGYLAACQNTKRLWKYNAEARNLLRDLSMERMKFENACEELLSGVIDLQELDLFLGDVGGPLWKQIHLEPVLQDKLGKSYDIFLDAAAAMRDALDELGGNLRKAMPNVSNTGLLHRRWRSFRLALSHDRNKTLIATMTKGNNDLSALLGHRKRMMLLKSTKPSAVTKWFTQLRSQALAIHNTVMMNVQMNCACIGVHEVYLQLEIRCSPDMTVAPGPANKSGDSCFNLLLTLVSQQPRTIDTRYWRCVAIGPPSPVHVAPLSQAPTLVIQESPSRSSTPGSDNSPATGINLRPDLAPSLSTRSVSPSIKETSFRQNLRRHFKKVSFSEAQSEESADQPQFPKSNSHDVTHAKHSDIQFDIDHLCQTFTRDHGPGVSFVNIGDEQQKQHHAAVKRDDSNREAMTCEALVGKLGHVAAFDRKITLLLAITLTTSVLQLHDTPWLRDDWSTESIWFPALANGATHEAMNVPYVCENIASPTQQPAPNAVIGANPTSTIVRNAIVFSLGIALIEIWFGKPISKLDSSPGNESPPVTSTGMSGHERAFGLIDKVYKQAGDWYGDAIRRCLYCDFNQRETKLENESMKEAVLKGVLEPLINHLRALQGGSLTDFGSMVT